MSSRPALLTRPGLVAVVRRPAVPVVIGVVLTALLASGAAWSATGKTAYLSVDGQAQEVDFRGGTVEDVLAAAGLEVSERDLLVPDAGTEVADGDRIALRRARQITVVVDGQEREVWVTASSVAEALDQLGLVGQNLGLSASRSRGIPLDGFRLDVRTPKNISILADNAVKPVTTAAANVRAALIEADVHLDGDDRLSHDRYAEVTDLMVVRVTRVSRKRISETVPVAFQTERREDPNLFTGETKTLKAGKKGLVRRTVETVHADGKLEKRTVLSSTTLAAPVTRVLAVGTKPRPARASSRRGTGDADSLNWPALARCESGGNPRAVSPGGRYRGLYQFSLSTWRSVGGQGDPIDNSAGEQTYRAKLLYQRSGAGQWPHCGKYLFS